MRAIRYFATTDDSDVGRVALEYLKGLLHIAPVRLLPVGAGLWGRWEPYAPLLITPCTDFINVVCCPPSNWSWVQRVPMPVTDGSGTVLSTEIATTRVELYTAGVRNILLAASPPPAYPPALETALATALRYQAFVVPWTNLWTAWDRVDCHPRIVPVPVQDHAAMRDAILT